MIERAEDFRRLTAPLRALGQSLLRPRGRRRDRDPYEREPDERDEDSYARDPGGPAAI